MNPMRSADNGENKPFEIGIRFSAESEEAAIDTLTQVYRRLNGVFYDGICHLYDDGEQVLAGLLLYDRQPQNSAEGD